MSRLVIILSLAVLAVDQAKAQGTDITDTVIGEFRSVCLPATEGNFAPRDLAQKAGYIVEAAPPLPVRRAFPATALGSLSLSKQIGAATVHVTSTVLLPPSTVYACLVFSEGPVTDFSAKVDRAFTGNGQKYKISGETASSNGRVTLIYFDKARKEADNIIGISGRFLGGDPAIMLVSYKVDATGMAAAADIATHCAAGTMPHPEILCEAKGRP